jgi:hypothetical protein
MGIKKSKLALYLLNITALTSFLLLLFYSLTSKNAMVGLFTCASYYLIWLMIIVWTVQTVLFLKSLDFSLKLLLKKYWPGILIALALTTLVFCSVSVRFKTLSDETNFLSVSRSMVMDKLCVNSTMGKFYYGNLNTINREIPVFPLVFPFMVHLVHAVTGFRYQNSFAVNFIVMFLLLSGVYIAARRFSDMPTAVAAMLLVLCYPVITIFGTSGGFDFLNTAFFMLVVAATYCFVKTPSSRSFAFLFASLLVLANIRYESAAFLFILSLLLIALGKIKWQHLKDCSRLLFVTPLLSLPYIWQRVLTWGTHKSYYQTPTFSFAQMVQNLTNFFKNLVDFDYFLPYAGFVSIVSMLILVYLIIETIRKRILLQREQRIFLIVLIVIYSVSSIIYFAYFFGFYVHPSGARFFMILSVLFALAPVALRVLKPHLLSGTALLIISSVCFLFYHPIAVEDRFINTLTLNRRTDHCIDFIEKLNSRNILIIDPRPGQYTALGYGAVNFAYANENRNLILTEAQRHLYTGIIVFQQIKYDTEQPTEDTILNQDYKLNPLYEIQVTADEFLRISEVDVSLSRVHGPES